MRVGNISWRIFTSGVENYVGQVATVKVHTGLGSLNTFLGFFGRCWCYFCDFWCWVPTDHSDHSGHLEWTDFDMTQFVNCSHNKIKKSDTIRSL